MAGGDLGGMLNDPSMGPSMGGDPNMAGDGEETPNRPETESGQNPGEDNPDQGQFEDSDMDGDGTGDVEEINDVAQKLSPADRKAVLSYAESMLSRDETNDEDDGAGMEAGETGGETTPQTAPQVPPMPQQPMMEIRKRDLMRIQRKMNETLMDQGEKRYSDRNQKKVNRSGFSGPFSSPIR